jgi:hypothetical protein
VPTEPIESLSDPAQFGDHVSCTTTRGGKIIGFTESQGRGRTGSGDIDGSGLVAITLTGVPPRGEAGTLKACQRFVDHINSKFAQSWASPTEVRGVQHVDAEAVGFGPLAGLKLTIQVVRALTDPVFWKDLGYDGHVSLSLPLDGAASVLKAAVELKSGKIPLTIRPLLTLILDATDVPALSLDGVVDEFNKGRGGWVDAQGFQSVWVVGPWNSMIRRLTGANG